MQPRAIWPGRVLGAGALLDSVAFDDYSRPAWNNWDGGSGLSTFTEGFEGADTVRMATTGPSPRSGRLSAMAPANRTLAEPRRRGARWGRSRGWSCLDQVTAGG
ncbi:hypothetical protein GCM10010519_35370 [Streptomyces lactacystinicus]